MFGFNYYMKVIVDWTFGGDFSMKTKQVTERNKKRSVIKLLTFINHIPLTFYLIFFQRP